MSEYRHEIKREEHANIKLTIHVPQETVQSIYQENITSIAKKAHIKGFRKGKVPVSVLEQKFGDTLRAEATEKIINEAVQKVLEHVEFKPLHFSQFKLDSPEDAETVPQLIHPDEEYSFTITYDTHPLIELADIKNLSLPNFKCTPNEVDITKELEDIQMRNIIYADTSTALKEGEEATVNFVELDAQGNEIEDSRRQDFVMTIGEETSIYKIDDELLGMKKDDVKTLTKSYPKDYQFPDIADRTITLKITVTRTRKKDIPPIDDELAKDVSDKFNTLEELKKEIIHQLERRSEQIIEDLHRRLIIEYLAAHSSIELPHSAVEFQLEHNWNGFVEQTGTDEKTLIKNLKHADYNKEQLFEKWRPNAEAQVKEQFIYQKLMDDDKKEISDEEFEHYIKLECEHTGENYEEIMKYYTQHPQIIPQIKFDMKKKKILQKLKEVTIVDSEEKLSFSELMEYINSSQNNNSTQE